MQTPRVLIHPLTLLLLGFASIHLCGADTSGKTLRILKIGNSFSQNATEHLQQLAASQGHTVIFGRAEIGGCSLQKHWSLAEKFEKNPEDADGKPYQVRIDDDADANQLKKQSGKKYVSLKELLQSNAWDIVTLQQHSLSAPDIETFRPYVGNLANYIRKYAPNAKIWMHETWAYRADDKLFKTKSTSSKTASQERMYQFIHETYATIATEIEAEKVIPCATAFQNARKDPRWQLEVESDFDPKKLEYPQVPRQVHALCVGWKWDTKTKQPKLVFDGKHCSTAGKYLGALVWHESLLGPVNTAAYKPKDLADEDAAFLQEIARKTVRDGLKP